MNAVNPNILNEVSEAQVVEWLGAKLMQCRTKVPSMHRLDISAGVYSDGELSVRWDAVAGSECVIMLSSSDEATDALARRIGNPADLAAKKRQEAAALLAEAERLEGSSKIAIAA